MNKERVAIVGAGLCGTLLALRLGQRGYTVDLYERRPDLRKTDLAAGRSINLALSDRGLRALDMVGAKDRMKDQIIPMKGRMLHDTAGKTKLSPYSGRQGEHINSVSRSGLNAELLNMADEWPEVTLYFDQACSRYDIDSGTLEFTTPQGKTTKKSYDLVFGADGAGSVIRSSFLARSNQIRFDFEQKFLSHGYKELEFPATPEGDFAVASHALHIWPRDEFMMIALPNLDKSFTVTLFQDYEGAQGFNALQSNQQIQSFFEEHFPDAIPHMPNLLRDFRENPTSSLGTIKCAPWHIEDKVLMVGDAVHAIVPFYGQGMNCAFEDITVLDQFMDDYNENWSEIFPAYSQDRKKDTDAIADLALDNFHEMQDHVNDENFSKKRSLEMFFENTYSDYFSKYSLVTFRADVPYHRAMVQGRYQDKYLLDAVDSYSSIENMDKDSIYRNLMEAVAKKWGPLPSTETIS
jgi:kynurenine 3-monooxygenase